jgi:hypothetical protein
MKGPGNRLKFVVRREWACPQCHRRLVTPGSVVQQPCNCRSQDDARGPLWMQLIQDPLGSPLGTFVPDAAAEA